MSTCISTIRRQVFFVLELQELENDEGRLDEDEDELKKTLISPFAVKSTIAIMGKKMMGG